MDSSQMLVLLTAPLLPTRTLDVGLPQHLLACNMQPLRPIWCHGDGASWGFVFCCELPTTYVCDSASHSFSPPLPRDFFILPPHMPPLLPFQSSHPPQKATSPTVGPMNMLELKTGFDLNIIFAALMRSQNNPFCAQLHSGTHTRCAPKAPTLQFLLLFVSTPC